MSKYSINFFLKRQKLNNYLNFMIVIIRTKRYKINKKMYSIVFER